MSEIDRIRKKLAPLKARLAELRKEEQKQREREREAKERARARMEHVWEDFIVTPIAGSCSYYWIGEYERPGKVVHYFRRCGAGRGSVTDESTGLHFCLRHARMMWPHKYGFNKGPRKLCGKCSDGR